MPSSSPTWIRETGIVLLWGAAAANVFIYTTKAFRATYSSMDISGGDGVSPVFEGAKVQKKTPAKAHADFMQGKGTPNVGSTSAKGIAAIGDVAGAAFGKQGVGTRLATNVGRSAQPEFGTTQASAGLGQKIINWFGGLF